MTQILMDKIVLDQITMKEIGLYRITIAAPPSFVFTITTLEAMIPSP
ncbi:unnamed protein product, partial [marine sediment metagenome]